MLKRLVKDSFAYGIANTAQKLVPFFIIPIVTSYMGQQALKVFDVSFLYAYIFSWLIISGQDAAASVLFFDEKKRQFDKRSVTAASLLIQLVLLAIVCAVIFPFSQPVSRMLFPTEADIARWWTRALLILPGHILLNYALNLLLWQRKRTAYITLCLVQSLVSLLAVYVSVVLMDGGLPELFFSLIGSTTLAGLVGLILIRDWVIVRPFPFNKKLYSKLLVLGLPFALTSFFHQLLPSIDRYFLIRFGYGEVMAPYILAVKLGAMMAFAVSAFVLAFTPYSMAKLNEDDAEAEISSLFRFVSVAAFLLVPLLLLFRNVLVNIFADASYQFSTSLLPFFFYGWVFDLFSYFSTLGVYRSQKSYMLFWFFGLGLLITIVLNLLLVPVWGLYGAATAFVLSKLVLFFLPLIWLRKTFALKIDHLLFWGSLALALLCSYLMYVVPWFVGLLIFVLLAALAAWYFRRHFMAAVGPLLSGFRQR